jgi:hypothetical protein
LSIKGKLFPITYTVVTNPENKQPELWMSGRSWFKFLGYSLTKNRFERVFNRRIVDTFKIVCADLLYRDKLLRIPKNSIEFINEDTMFINIDGVLDLQNKMNMWLNSTDLNEIFTRLWMHNKYGTIIPLNCRYIKM